jgi:hypothetical protein
MRENRNAGHRRESGGGDEAFIGGPRWRSCRRTGNRPDAIRIGVRRPGFCP